ncbi:GNAT family N-acetyltransferase [Janibacter alittae]|uniref:GNAT family N-acetyltransferase n=1 Tax=Janibacter alittae TaxID=3115209 RepID=A0ABZ2MGR5_9MICO
MTDRRHHRTERLRLDAPTIDDLGALHEIYSDPRVWTHFPVMRHTNAQRTRSMLEGWIDAWDRDGLGQWIVRAPDDDAVLGHAGCSLRPAGWWNLGYRFAAETHGRGLATEAARAGLEAAVAVRPEAPVVAYLLEHNVASRRVAEKLGLTLQQRGQDFCNPDPDAVRLVYADRDLDGEQLAATLR